MATRSGRPMLVARFGSASRNSNRTPIALATPSAPAVAVHPFGNSSGALLLELSRSFTDRLLAPRRKYLNGRRTNDRYVDALRRDVGSTAPNKPKPMQIILAIALADIAEPDMPVEAVATTFEAIANVVRARARELRLEGKRAVSLAPIIAAENDAEHRENTIEDRVIADENDPVALRQLLDANLAETEHMARVRQALEQKLAELSLRVAAPEERR